jgi:hypothetical protein
LERRRLALHARLREIEAALAVELAALEQASVDRSALGAQPHLPEALRQVAGRQAASRRRAADLREERGECTALARAIQERQDRLARGIPDPPRAHLANLAAPVPEPDYRWQRLAELWAALSVAALVAGVLALFYTDGALRAPHLLVLVVGFLIVDAVLRRQLSSLVTGMAIVLAIVTSLILIYEWSWQMLIGGLVVAVLYLAWTNMREIFS